MPALPEGETPPADGALPASAVTGAAERRFGVYLHVPFCRVRCGYCDFNTYTNAELGGGGSATAYAATAASEIALAARVLADAGLPPRQVSTVFVGGGTPTLLPVADLAQMLAVVRDTWGLAPDAEVTTEANPDSVTPQSLAELAAAGFTRVSVGMQSAVPHVLGTLDRTHDPARLPDVVAGARAAGLQVSVDLIYGTPGESLADWWRSLETALALEPDHVSAYALGIEPGTKMGSQVRRGVLPMPDPDVQAEMYELADELLAGAGYSWYEVSNWARGPEHVCRHNLGYWRDDDWWGIGPGAHSHVGDVRWWNVKHPRAYAQRLAQGLSPAHGREVLPARSRELERLMLGVRLAEGVDLDPAVGGTPERLRPVMAGLIADGLVEPGPAFRGRVVLTLRGRLLADGVVRALVD